MNPTVSTETPINDPGPRKREGFFQEALKTLGDVAQFIDGLIIAQRPHGMVDTSLPASELAGVTAAPPSPSL